MVSAENVSSADTLYHLFFFLKTSDTQTNDRSRGLSTKSLFLKPECPKSLLSTFFSKVPLKCLTLLRKVILSSSSVWDLLIVVFVFVFLDRPHAADLWVVEWQQSGN
jgi:hypothetical protein